MLPRSVVIVDLDDTLIPDVAARDLAATRLAVMIGSPASAAAILDAAREQWRASPCRGLPEMTEVSSWEALWTNFDDRAFSPSVAADGHGYQQRVWRAVLDRCSTEITPEQAASCFAQARREYVRPLQHAANVVQSWSTDHQLWLVTHGSSSLQREKLKLSGLADHFARVFISGELGMHKASPEFLQLLIGEIRAGELEVCSVVGDGMSSDMELAKAGRWHGIHLCSASGAACAAATPETDHISTLNAAVLPCQLSPASSDYVDRTVAGYP